MKNILIAALALLLSQTAQAAEFVITETDTGVIVEYNGQVSERPAAEAKREGMGAAKPAETSGEATPAEGSKPADAATAVTGTTPVEVEVAAPASQPAADIEDKEERLSRPGRKNPAPVPRGRRFRSAPPPEE